MALVGNLRDFGLSDFLYLVDRGYKTGMLVLQRPGDQARLFFQNGKLVYAMQNTTEDRLGDLLVRAGKITQGAARLRHVPPADRGDQQAAGPDPGGAGLHHPRGHHSHRAQPDRGDGLPALRLDRGRFSLRAGCDARRAKA